MKLTEKYDLTRLSQGSLVKSAFSGIAPVPGSPYYVPPTMTVGQTMYNVGVDSSLSPYQKRQINGAIVNTGIGVNSPAKNLLKAGVGAMAGNFIGKMLGVGPFWRGVMTATGANYGYKY